MADFRSKSAIGALNSSLRLAPERIKPFVASCKIAVLTPNVKNPKRDNVNDGNQLTLDIRETLTFFDEQPEDSIGHATALAVLMGEDLALAAFLHCFEDSGGKNLRVLPGPVKRTGKYGPWLDRWISADYCGRNLLFQAEVKSASAHGTTGVPVPVCTPKDQLQEQKWKAWSREWDSSRRTLRDPAYRKVLVRMDPPGGL